MISSNAQIITHRPRILQLLLEQCILQEIIEVQINKQEQVFSTHIMDCPPNLIQKPDKKDQPGIAGSPGPFSYLKEEQYLLLEPLAPDEGGPQINTDAPLLIRFFNGYNALEADVTSKGYLDVQGKSALQVSFPLQLRLIHTRKHLRVLLLPDSKITLIINDTIMREFKARIKDMSTSGLSFCYPLDTDLLPINTKINMIVSVLGEDDLAVEASIRHYTTISQSTCCTDTAICGLRPDSPRVLCGVKFSSLNPSQEKRVDELIALIQREYLIKEKEDLLRFNEELERKVKEKTEQLRQKDLQLLEMDRIAGIATLAAGVAHEINNHLSFVKSSIGFVKKGLDKMVQTSKYWDDKPVPEPILKGYKDYLEQINFDYLTSSMGDKFDRIKNGIERIMTIVNSLKSISRVDREDIGKIDINQSIEEALGVLRTQVPEDVEFVRELEKVPLIECSTIEINQCLLHIIQNAIDAVGGNGIIKISNSFNEKEDQILIKIIDNGKGMSPEVLRQVFNPFFTTKQVGSGTGVGLSIIERIIKRHSGKIDISSKEGLGTTVTIILPVVGEKIREQQ